MGVCESESAGMCFGRELISLFCEFVCMLFGPCMASICVLEESLNVCPVMFLLSAVSVVVLPGCLPLPVPLMCQ